MKEDLGGKRREMMVVQKGKKGLKMEEDGSKEITEMLWTVKEAGRRVQRRTSPLKRPEMTEGGAEGGGGALTVAVRGLMGDVGGAGQK